jgi:ATP-dependent DNA helicase RecQ
MNDQALHILQTVFGYETFRPRQEEVIDRLIAGNDALVLMPTGGGKSLCYQIPAMVRPGTGIIVSPLISLMQDQVSALEQSGVRGAYLNSTQDTEEGLRVEKQLLDGELDLVYVAPERLLSPRFLDLLGRARLALFAIDEAHCVSQWGHDFRRDYLELSVLHERFPEIPRIALTATADETTRSEIIKRLNLEKARIVVCGFDRPNIRYHITMKQKPREQLLRFIEDRHKGDAGIVYCLSRKKVDSTAEWLREKGFRALAYHAGLRAEVRGRHQGRFLTEEGIIIVATIAFGLGIDKPDVRFVAHMDLPKSIEAYYQETGRAGRDGLPADAWMVYGLQDIVMLRRMIEGSETDETRKRVERHKLDALVGLCEVTTCRRQALLTHFGEKPPLHCSNCDNCLEPTEQWDGTVAAQKILSCAYRTGQRFGAVHLIDILLGHDTERIRRLGHDRLSTFAVGKELDAQEWRSVIRQLVARNFLSVDVEGFGSLKLTEESRALLKGDVKLNLRKEKKPEKKPKKERGGRRRGPFTEGSEPGDKKLWEALKERRTEIAREQGVPPYVIFHNTTFMEMVECRPQDLEQMRLITGIGERKLELYGDDFLKIIREHSSNPVPPPGGRALIPTNKA